MVVTHKLVIISYSKSFPESRLTENLKGIGRKTTNTPIAAMSLRILTKAKPSPCQLGLLRMPI